MKAMGVNKMPEFARPAESVASTRRSVTGGGPTLQAEWDAVLRDLEKVKTATISRGVGQETARLIDIQVRVSRINLHVELVSRLAESVNSTLKRFQTP